MNFVDYTKKLIYNFSNKNPDGSPTRLLVVGSGFKLEGYTNHIYIEKNDPEMDLNDWMMFRRNIDSEMFDGVILSRVLEHFPVRHLDWYLYNLYTIMRQNAKLICIVPDMWETAKMLEDQFASQQPDLFKTNRLTYELLSEGDHVWDRHATWTSERSIKYYLEMEDLFEVEKITKIEIDSTIVPRELEVIARRK